MTSAGEGVGTIFADLPPSMTQTQTSPSSTSTPKLALPFGQIHLTTLILPEYAKYLRKKSTVFDEATWKGLVDRWSYDLFSRKPEPPRAVLGADGKTLELKPTSLDMAALLSALAERRAVVQIPHYASRRGGSKNTKNQVNLSADMRRGRIIGVTSNADVFSFGLKIEDMSVLQASLDGGKLGAPRNFMIVDVDGDWYEGWDQIDFVPDAKENEFIGDFQLAIGGDILFDQFISANRWTGFFGEDYIIAKLAIERAEQEAKFYKEEANRLSKFAPPAEYKGSFSMNANAGDKDPRETKDVQVTAFNAKIEFPEVGGVDHFIALPESAEAYKVAKEREKFLSYNILPKLRFATRATEYAFFQHVQAKGMNSFPSWVDKANRTWQVGYREPGKRTDWNRIELRHISKSFSQGALMWRSFSKKEKVTGR